MVEVELYGLPRLYGGAERAAIPAGTLAEVLAALAEALPGLSPAILRDGRPTELVRVALDGGVIIDAPDHRLESGDVLVLVSAQAGG
ncbi:MAG: MoaD/ThiS family protein [Nannocystaceae bacterium]